MRSSILSVCYPLSCIIFVKISESHIVVWCLWMRLASLCYICSYTALRHCRSPNWWDSTHFYLLTIYHCPYFYHTKENLLGHLLRHLVLLLSGICIFALHARCLQSWQAGTVYVFWLPFGTGSISILCKIFVKCFSLVSILCQYNAGVIQGFLHHCYLAVYTFLFLE